MKKLLKSEICGSMNSTQCTVCGRKVNICCYCSLNSTWTVTAFCQNAWKKKKKKNAKRRRVKRSIQTNALELTQESRFSLLFWKGIVSSSVLCLKTNAHLCDSWRWEDSILWWWFDAGTLISFNIHEISLDQECPLMNQSLCTEFLWFRYQCGV